MFALSKIKNFPNVNKKLFRRFAMKIDIIYITQLTYFNELLMH